MPTNTTTYSFQKPVVGADEDSWGGYLNSNWDKVDDLFDGTTAITGIDINSGTIDGTVIGGSSAAAITGTTITGTSFVSSGDMTFGDNDKAIFGAGSDLQIYSDGDHSYISEAGATGSLYIDGTNLRLRSTAGDVYLKAVSDGAVDLYYDNALKLATTATGVDITGTLTSDGLTVEGDVEIRTSGNNMLSLVDTTASFRPTIRFMKNDGTDTILHLLRDEDGELDILRGASALTQARFGSNGDISFYEDTGTTAKFFWDASAESLGIGTSSPTSTASLHIQGSGGASGASVNVAANELFIDNNGNTGMTLGSATTGTAYYAFADSDVTLRAGIFYDHSTDDMGFRVSSSTRMTIDSSGNLLVGKSSASFSTAGHELRAGAAAIFVRDGNDALSLNRLTSDGDIAKFSKDGTTVGSIGTANSGDLYIGNDDTTLLFAGGSDAILPRGTAGAVRDAAISFGVASNRFKDLYLSGGVYLGGTGSANLLDDYEEGTWTPVITPELGSAASITVNHATYTKVGRLVSLVFDVTIDSISGTDSTRAIELTGMPFNSATSHGGGPNIGYGGLTASMTGTLALVQYSTSKYRIVNLDGSNGLNASDHLQATSRLEGQFTYHTT